jgi:hypothetical protein
MIKFKNMNFRGRDFVYNGIILEIAIVKKN